MRFTRHLILFLAACTMSACASKTGGDELQATSTSFFHYSYNSNYYGNPHPYFTLHLLPDGKNLAVGQFYGSKGGDSFAFEYRGAKNQLDEIESILEKHGFYSMPIFSFSGTRIDHAPTYTLQFTYNSRSHYVVWDRRSLGNDTRDAMMKPLIIELEDYLKIPQIIEQFEQERE